MCCILNFGPILHALKSLVPSKHSLPYGSCKGVWRWHTPSVEEPKEKAENQVNDPTIIEFQAMDNLMCTTKVNEIPMGAKYSFQKHKVLEIEDMTTKKNKTFGIDLLTSLPQSCELTICYDSLLW